MPSLKALLGQWEGRENSILYKRNRVHLGETFATLIKKWKTDHSVFYQLLSRSLPLYFEYKDRSEGISHTSVGMEDVSQVFNKVLGRYKDSGNVRFWENPERSGWLWKQGELFRNWRRRWFVLKDGKLFWFKSDAVTPVRSSF